MKELTLEELKEIQLNILDYVDAFCRKNNIQYTIAFGTLLGAARHGGFIPWDDDIDIQLLRSEYDKLTQLWNKNKNEHPFELVNIESGNNMGYPFGKIHDPRTITLVDNVERTGVFIDVFPIDYVLDEADYQNRSMEINKLCKERIALFTWMRIKESNMPFYRKLMAYFHKPSKSYEEIAIEISDISKKISIKTDYVFDLINGRYSKNIIPSGVYDNYIDIRFEDRIYRSIKDFDTFLTLTYGDWRTPPPEEKRITHHAFKAYWR